MLIISLTILWANFIKPISILGVPDKTLPDWQANILKAQLISNISTLTKTDSSHKEIYEFTVLPGEPASSVTNRLAQTELISNSDILNKYMVYKGLDHQIQSGYFQFTKQMSPIEIANALTSSIPSEIAFYVWPGWRYEQLAESLSRHPHLDVNKNIFLSIANRKIPLQKTYSFVNQIPENLSLEGYFYPGRYLFPPKATASEIIILLLDTFETKTSSIRPINGTSGLTLHETITLASIVQREMVIPNEAPYISSVFLNRLTYNMPLGADATTQYALATQNNWWPKLTIDPRTVKNEYNTYIINGLPPGPICNPGTDALNSVINPTHSDYLYFRAACDNSGKHNFSYSYEQHLQYSCN